MKLLIVLGLLALGSTLAWASGSTGGRPMTVDDLLAVKSVSDPQVSPDGTLVAYVVTEVDREANKSNSSLWLVSTRGGEPKRLTTTPGTNTHPRWSPDGRTLAFVSNRSGSNQIWLLPIDGGEPRPLTRLPIDVSGPIWSPQGDRLAFTAEVYPNTTPEETAERDKQKAESQSKARTYDGLMIRHWMSWDEGKRSHLFVCDAQTGEARDLIPHWTANVPPAPFGGSSDYAFNGDGTQIAFTSEPLENAAASTNTDLWLVSTEGGEPLNLTADNPAADAQPAFSADGRLLAWLRQQRPGFEADQWVLVFRPAADHTSRPVAVSQGLDRPISSFRWDPTKPHLVAVVDDGGVQTVYDVPTLGRSAPVQLLAGANHADASRTQDGTLIFVRSRAHRPAEIYRASADGSESTPLTHHNDDLIAQLDLNPAERFEFEAADGAKVQGWLVKPPSFEAGKKYPVMFLIHGGPQGAWHDEWHARWNYALFAAPGFAIVAINPRGSTGFGQAFTDAISKNWNGQVYDDLMRGLDHALKTFDFLDSERVLAAGGSFGGYMVNWIAGQTDRFRALISHAGIFDLTSMNATTEELWFPIWEFGGMPWDTPELHLAQSPSTYARNFKTPTLVIHGALDFRVPDMQGLAMFTALQQRGVPSRYVWFPDEGHWILKPANRVVWWNEVHNWMKRHAGLTP
ncbi:MAG: peptidase S9 [Isosphaeraceae bacterium]|jgi:dipeptidyl aminopeptidase/acylaminoacyl peptidase|nr:MAG: peptidase S9 [Isosphaeraceae bacterium]